MSHVAAGVVSREICHRREQTLLYQIIERHCPELRNVMTKQGKSKE
jgi:hypothetical protein